MSENELEKQNCPDNEERNIIVLGILTSIIFSFVPSLIIYLVYGKDRLSPLAYKSVISLLNFEIYVFLICLVALILSSVLFILTSFVFSALLIFNLIICIKSFQAYDKGEEYNYPLKAPFIK